MLKELKIKNLAIIDDLTVRFDGGLNVLTGETGAGKSIIVDALGLALGDRAQSDLIKSGEKEASVQAFFDLEEDIAGLPDIGIDLSEGLLLRRTISNSGKSRAYINDTMVTLQTLAETGRLLVDIHSQHEHQSLLTAEKQRNMLDAYGGLRNEVEKVGRCHEAVQKTLNELNDLTGKVKERAYRMDLLSFQVDEIEKAGLLPDERQELEEERQLLANAGRLQEATQAAYSILHEEEGCCLDDLSKAISRLRDLSSFDSGLKQVLEELESAKPLLEDAAISLRSCRDRYNVDPGRLDQVEERLELIRRLSKKYGESIKDILEYRDRAAEELATLTASDERLHGLEEELKDLNEKLSNAAVTLSEKRKKTAGKIESLIEKNLKDLAFGSAKFMIDIRQELTQDGKPKISSNGMDRIEFLFSANAGEPLKPLSKTASGGELSRIMLCLKTILADVDNVPVLIFDEVDAGIGGKTAESVGQKLVNISSKHQLICITHLPQIARHADSHLRIEKVQKKNSVAVEINQLSGEERSEEIARMLSGTVTDISKRHAEELLAGRR